MRLIIWIKFENETVKYEAVFFFDLSISHKRFLHGRPRSISFPQLPRFG